MKFGKSLEREGQDLPAEWQQYLVHYKDLKKCIRKIVTELEDADSVIRLESGGLFVKLTNGQIALPQQVTYAFSGTGSEVHPTLQIVLSDESETSASTTDDDTAEEGEEEEERDKADAKLPINGTNKQQVADSSVLFNEEIKKEEVKKEAEEDKVIPDTSLPLIDDKLLFNHQTTLPAMNEYGQRPRRATLTIINRVTGLLEQRTISYELQADTEFFRHLTNTLSEINAFHIEAQNDYNARIQQITSLLAKGASPYGKDLYTWREIIELYLKAEIWTVEKATSREDTPFLVARNKLDWFLQEEQRLGLRKRLQLASSRQTMNAFVHLLNELCSIRHMQSLNQLAVAKILKKHDKRTHLSTVLLSCIYEQHPFFTMNLSHNIVMAICDKFVAIVPRVDDYACPICYGLCWKPIRLVCRHLFCLRCLIKAQKTDMHDCPICRHPKAVIDAYADQLDTPLMNMLALYFPHIDREVGLEEAQMISGVDWRSSEERGMMRKEDTCTIS
ncbi:SPX domain-containing protein [Syncephalis fuscata]|nr:SPX domain-containing protein [Syncephalis fuscata]